VNHEVMHWVSMAGWLLVSFFLSGMEAGVFALSRLRVRQRARAGSGNARRLLAGGFPLDHSRWKHGGQFCSRGPHLAGSSELGSGT